MALIDTCGNVAEWAMPSYDEPDMPETDVTELEITNTDEDFPDNWNDDADEALHNEPEAEPLGEAVPPGSSRL